MMQPKNSFTLIELIIVIILVSTVSFLTLSSFKFNSEKSYKVSLENIKEFMLENFEFEEELSLFCMEDGSLECYIFIDGNKNKNIEVKNLFSKIPKVYNYDKDLSEHEFSTTKLDNIEYRPFFELTIDSDKKHKNLVVDTNEEQVYLFSSVLKKAEVFNNTHQISDRFFRYEQEVKDAL